MEQNTGFPTQHIDFADHDEHLDDRQKQVKGLTILAASAISLLTYSPPQEAAQVLGRDDRFEFLRKHKILDGIWPLLAAKQAQTTRHKKGGPLLAWSTHLQTVFIGFPGAEVASDVLNDIDIRHGSDPATATRFYDGFSSRAASYVSLIRSLSTRYPVVVCGHSLGGTMATLAAHGAMAAHSTMHNVWQPDVAPGPNTRKVSVITFGSPALKVLEPPGSTVELRKDLKKNFHHVIASQDIIPFLANSPVRFGPKTYGTVKEFLKAAWPQDGLLFDVLGRVLKSWVDQLSLFDHFGSLHVIRPSKGQAAPVKCTLVRSTDDIPQQPDASELERFHSMAQYHLSMSQVFAVKKGFVTSAGSEIDWKEFPDHFHQFPALIEGCEGMVNEDKVIVPVSMPSDIAQFLVADVVYSTGGVLTPVTAFRFESEQTRSGKKFWLVITQMMDLSRGDSDAIELAESMHQGICVIDIFDRKMKVEVSGMHYTSFRGVSQLHTFEAVLQTMIMALSDHITKIQTLRLSRASRGDSHENGIETGADQLSEMAAKIAGQIDKMTSLASPHLVVARFHHAFALSEKVKSDYLSGGSSTRDDISMQGSDEQTEPPPTTLIDSDSLPSSCVGHLRSLLTEMWKAFEQAGLNGPFTEVEWAKKTHPSLVDLYQNVPKLSDALKEYGLDLYRRPSNLGGEARINTAIDQAEKVLDVMQFCHIIILSQIDAPPEWFGSILKKTTSRGFRWSDMGKLKSDVRDFMVNTARNGPWDMLKDTIMTLGVPGAFFAGASIAGYNTLFGQKVNYHSYFSLFRREANRSNPSVDQVENRPLLNYDSLVDAAQTAVCLLDETNTYNTAEECVTKYMVGFMHRARSDNRQDVYGDLIKAMNQALQMPEATYYRPNDYFLLFLAQVSRIGVMRRMTSDKLYVGVEGPTEAGKSLLLKVFTAAPESIFNPGFGAQCRTTELQTYKPEGCKAVFADCPGFDDRNERIRNFSRLFRSLMHIIIFVVPFGQTRAKGREEMWTGQIASYIKNREMHHDRRPFRILINKIDQLSSMDEEQTEVPRKQVSELKAEVIAEIRRLGGLDDDFQTKTRKSVNGKIVAIMENLEDIVQPFSTYAQVSKAGMKALSDCQAGERPKMSDPETRQNLYQLAESGLIWDVESLRQWLRGFSTDIIHDSGRGRVS